MNAMVNAESTIYGRIGSVLNVQLASEDDVYNATKAGLPVSGYQNAVAVLGFPSKLVGSESTIRRRLTNEEGTFPADESERLMRIVRVFVEAEEIFGDKARALLWFKTPEEFVEGQPAISPMELAATDSGARIIERRIRKTAHGIY